MRYQAMLAKTRGKEGVFNKDYLFEPKLDGYRALCYKDSRLTFISRNNNDLTNEFPELQHAELIKAKEAVLDGEIVSYNSRGLPDFNMLQNRKRKKISASFVVFDILEKDSTDLTMLPLTKRKEILKETVEENGNIQTVPFTEDGEQLIKMMKEKNMEGVVAKKKTSRYVQGRSSYWLKMKFTKTVDCVILGFSTKKREISSLYLGLYNSKLNYIGKVGTGFDPIKFEELKKKMIGLQIKEPPLRLKEKDACWLEPTLVAEISYSELTKGGRLREPVYKWLREDKQARDCTIDQVKNA